MYRAYKAHRFTQAAMDTLDAAQGIIEELSGYTLTLRQLYYQFVSRGLIENTEREYKRLGRVVTDAREAGMMSWYAIEDRGRGAMSWELEEDPAAVLEGVEDELTYDLWDRMGVYLEVWVEKQALESVVGRTCSRYRVPYMACKGYLSASEAWRAGQRFLEARDAGRECVLLHLGDHDPSGIDMTRDNAGRLEMFSEGFVDVRRLALNMDQVEEHGPPPNPTKVKDSRAPGYIASYGHDSWELDALHPTVLDGVLTEAIEGYIDAGPWRQALREEREARHELSMLSERWDEVRELLAS